jgi:hypothetical protein
MKTITVGADEEIIRQAKLVAHIQGKLLNSAFREWLVESPASPDKRRKQRL